MNPNHAPPIIRLEINQMRRTLSVMLSEYAASMDKDLQAAVNDFCSEPRLKEIISNEANRVMEQVIREEVNRWFRDGEGREVIKAEVVKKLSENLSFTPLDDDFVKD